MSILKPMASHVLRDMTDAYRARMEEFGEVFGESGSCEEARQLAMRDALYAAGLRCPAEVKEHNHEYHDEETRPPLSELEQKQP